MKVDLFDLFKEAGKVAQQPQLNEDQELELAADRRLFMSLYLALEGKPFAKIAEAVGVTSEKAQSLLIRLDQLGLIELHAENKIVPLYPKSVRWLADGPLHEKYGEMIRKDFMDSSFDGDQEKLWLESGYISKASLEVFGRKFDKLLSEFRELISLDEASSVKERVNITFVSAYRPWILPVFKRD